MTDKGIDKRIEGLAKPNIGPVRAYATCAIISSCVFTFIIMIFFPRLEAAIVPIAVIVIALSRSGILIAPLLAVVYFLLWLSIEFEYWPPANVSSYVVEGYVSLPILVTVLSICRLLTIAKLDRDVFKLSSHNTLPQRDIASFAPGEIRDMFSLVAIAFLGAGVVLFMVECDERHARRYFELQPRGMRTVQLVFFSFVLVTIARCLLGYQKLKMNHRFESSLILRHDLWNTMGRDHALVGKLRQKFSDRKPRKNEPNHRADAD